jgi:hypothetical protein
MPTFDYRLADGTRVPGVTTVIRNLGWSTENLIRWANRQGLAGVDVRERVGVSTPATRPAELGTLIHDQIEADILGRAPTLLVPDDMKAQVAQGRQTFHSWLGNSRLEIVEPEHPFVDEEMRTGGCIDAILRSPTGTPIGDWKTGGGPYAEHFVQVAAYAEFYERKTGTTVEGAHVVRFGKDNGIFHHVFFPRDTLKRGWALFTWLRAIHEMKAEIQGYVR